MNNNITDTLWLDEENVSLCIIDQTLLPTKEIILSLTTPEEIWEAIYKLRLRGAPAIGVGAAIGLFVVAARFRTESVNELREYIKKQADYLVSSRPTAVNLKWAIERMLKVSLDADDTCEDIIDTLLNEAKTIWEEDIEVCRKLGENGLSLIKEGDGILTHCNAGRLATVRYGTATSPFYLAAERGMKFSVYCDETRPLLQGARLTSYELSRAGIDTTLLCDNMAASLMKSGRIQAVFVGCDRVAANGDTANKIGTSQVAIVAKRFNIPVYIFAPFSTIDFATPTGEQIVIEERDKEEITTLWYENPMAPTNIKVFNPAFDVTPCDDITGFVTEKGILKPPFLVS